MRQNNSPWLHNFDKNRALVTMNGTVFTDLAIIGGGIAGMSTAYMLLKNTTYKISLIEGSKVAHGATGHNAGYAVAEFEKSFKEIVSEYGLDNARHGLAEYEDAFTIFQNICSEIGLKIPEKIKSFVAYSSQEHFLDTLHEEYLKYGELKSEIYLLKDSHWSKDIPENMLSKISFLEIEEMYKILGTNKKSLKYFQAVIVNHIAVSNSAIFTERLAAYLLEKYPNRFAIYENTFINSIRLLQNNRVILDSLYGVCMSDKVILCTNGFENFDIYGPYNMKIDKEFHHNVSGLIGYMIGTFTKSDESKDGGGVFYEEGYKHKNHPVDAGPYIYYTRRHFEYGLENGELFCVGGPEVKLHDRRLYKKDHEVDEKIYTEMEDFQKDIFSINAQPTFKWHGLMGYTKTGIRIVGRDVRFVDLFYNLGCNGIGLIPSIAGARRLARIIGGEKLPKSIFDPR